jgi:hypothetical protein
MEELNLTGNHLNGLRSLVGPIVIREIEKFALS